MISNTAAVGTSIQSQNTIQEITIPESQKKTTEVPMKKSKILDFLSSTGKIATILLAMTPLPTYLGCWGKSKQEQI